MEVYMKIIKYKKMSNGRYKVFFDNNDSLVLYEDIILKYNLLIKKEVNNNILKDLIKDNNNYQAYNLSVKYINTKIRCEKEIREYLTKKEINKDLINETINKLKKNNLLNDISYIKAYSYDKFHLNNDGPIKIKRELIKLGFKEDLIDNNIEFNKEELKEKLNTLIDKKIKTIKGYSGNVLKIKIINYFVEKGYERNLIVELLDLKDLDKDNLYQKEYDKLYKKYKNKYNEEELKRIIKQKLYIKGFKIKKNMLYI